MLGDTLCEGSQVPTGFFGRLVTLMKNKEPEKEAQLHEDLTSELQKLNDYLAARTTPGSYLAGDRISDLDCQVLPKLRHVEVAGRHYKNYEIPSKLSALKNYMKNEGCDVFKNTCPADSDIIWGWSKFFT